MLVVLIPGWGKVTARPSELPSTRVRPAKGQWLPASSGGPRKEIPVFVGFPQSTCMRFLRLASRAAATGETTRCGQSVAA